MATITYRLSNKTDKASKKNQILVDVSVSRSFRVRGRTRFYLSPSDWDDKANTIKKVSRISKKEKQEELEDMRGQLNRLQEHISMNLLEVQNFDEMKTIEDRQNWIEYVISSFYDPCVRLVKEKNLTFKEFAKVYVKIRSEEECWKVSHKSTLKKKVWDNPVYDKLCAVQTQINKMNPDLKMDDITGDTLDEYQRFLIMKGYKNNTIINHISYLKQILTWANERGYLRHGAEAVRHKVQHLEMAKPKAVNFLKWDEEFKVLFNHKFGPGQEHLELTRDRFCFCCATSLRHSDLEILKKSNFDDPDNPTSFTFVSKKTHDDLTIFMNDYSREIYNKYKDIPTPNGLLFPPKSNQKMNDNLKVIAEMLGFTREISKMQYCGKVRVEDTERLCDVIGTHSARRTFVVHALESGMSPQVVMTFTGHEDYETMKPYIALTDKTRKKCMEDTFGF